MQFVIVDEYEVVKVVRIIKLVMSSGCGCGFGYIVVVWRGKKKESV
jgi:hypothetical protein